MTLKPASQTASGVQPHWLLPPVMSARICRLDAKLFTCGVAHSSLLTPLCFCKADCGSVYRYFAVIQKPICLLCREDSRISTALVTALNSFLLKNGLDVSSRSADLHQAMQPFLLRAWRSSRDQKLKDSLVTYLNIQVRLGGLQV